MVVGCFQSRGDHVTIKSNLRLLRLRNIALLTSGLAAAVYGSDVWDWANNYYTAAKAEQRQAELKIIAEQKAHAKAKADTARWIHLVDSALGLKKTGSKPVTVFPEKEWLNDSTLGIYADRNQLNGRIDHYRRDSVVARDFFINGTILTDKNVPFLNDYADDVNKKTHDIVVARGILDSSKIQPFEPVIKRIVHDGKLVRKETHYDDVENGTSVTELYNDNGQLMRKDTRYDNDENGASATELYDGDQRSVNCDYVLNHVTVRPEQVPIINSFLDYRNSKIIRERLAVAPKDKLQKQEPVTIGTLIENMLQPLIELSKPPGQNQHTDQSAPRHRKSLKSNQQRP